MEIPILKKKKIFFEDWDFFTKLGKRHLNSIGNVAEFRPLRTHKQIPECIRAVKALASLRRCESSSELLLVA